jgi:tetratricopeptide (TPR) repeat protein
MRRALVFTCAMLAASSARGEIHELRTPRFTVLTDAGPDVGKAIARNLEIIRALLEEAFGIEQLGHRDHVVVHAVSSTGAMAELLPGLWENDEIRKPDGLFRKGPDKDYIVVRLDAPSETAYSTVYHEYFHVFARARFGKLPLWVDEGLAKFWEMTSVEAERVRIGVPSRRSLKLLTAEPSLPLPVLFTVDHGSPHYLDMDQSALFYAQTWAVVHYLLLGDETGERRGQLFDYVREPNEDVFGPLGALAAAVSTYTRQQRFTGIERPSPELTDDGEIRVRTLSEAEALAFRGELIVHGEAPERALPDLERALELDPTLAIAHEGLGFLRLRDGRVHEALEAFSRASALDSSSFLAHYYHAVASLRAGAAIETVLGDLDRSIRVNPDFAAAHLLVASAVAELGDDYERGLASAARAVALTPNDPEAHEVMGRLLVATGDDDAGIASYRHALELDTSEPRIYRELAFDLLALDLLDDASAALARARALEPDDADTAFALALALSEAGRTDAAIEAFENAIDLDPSAASYHYRLGELLVEHERYLEAAAALERALDLDPSAVAVRRDLGHALLSGGRPEAAIPHLRAALERAPGLGVLHYQLATALKATGAEVEAQEHFQRAEELGYQP